MCGLRGAGGKSAPVAPGARGPPLCPLRGRWAQERRVCPHLQGPPGGGRWAPRKEPGNYIGVTGCTGRREKKQHKIKKKFFFCGFVVLFFSFISYERRCLGKEEGETPGQRGLHVPRPWRPRGSPHPAASPERSGRGDLLSAGSGEAAARPRLRRESARAAGGEGRGRWKFMTKTRPGGDFTDLGAAPPPARVER